MASINNLKAGRPITVEGLGTNTFTATTAGPHHVRIASTVTPVSGLVIVINLNGSAVATTPALTASGMSVEIETNIQMAVSDVVTIVLTGNSAQDIIPNSIKSIITIDII